MALTLAIDQSTQGTKVLLVRSDGTIAYKTTKKHRQIISDQGWISHDLDEIEANLKALITQALSQLQGETLTGVAISNQRETAAAWTRSTGKPLDLAIVWQDNRAIDLVDALCNHPAFNNIKQTTGLALSPYFSAAKWAWIIQRNDAVEKAQQLGDLCLGTMDSWLVFKLTHGAEFKTEPSNACRTQLMNINTGSWDNQLCQAFGLHPDSLPQICDSNAQFGFTDLFGALQTPIPIISILGDSQAALFAEHCLQAGQYKITFGTGSSIMVNTGTKLIQAPNLNTSIAWRRNGQTTYVLEGNVNYSGALITWLKDHLHLIDSPAETDAMAQAANPRDTTMLIPAFSGMAAPYNRPHLKAAFLGMTMLTGANEIVRAGLDAVVYQITDIINLLATYSPKMVPVAHVDGGMIANHYLMQRLADLTQQTVAVSGIQELSGVGAALNGGKDHFSPLPIPNQYQPKISVESSVNQINRWTSQIKQLA